jgi:hypothetical protein
MSRKRTRTKNGARLTAAIEREVKRAEQKAAGVFDGRYRPRVVKSGKRYQRRPKHRGQQE